MSNKTATAVVAGALGIAGGSYIPSDSKTVVETVEVEKVVTQEVVKEVRFEAQ